MILIALLIRIYILGFNYKASFAFYVVSPIYQENDFYFPRVCVCLREKVREWNFKSEGTQDPRMCSRGSVEKK